MAIQEIKRWRLFCDFCDTVTEFIDTEEGRPEGWTLTFTQFDIKDRCPACTVKAVCQGKETD